MMKKCNKSNIANIRLLLEASQIPNRCMKLETQKDKNIF